MKKIIFFSRHDLSADAKNWLTKIFGKVSVDKVEIIFTDGSEIKPFIGKYDEFIIVAPNEVLQNIIAMGIKPLQVVMSFRDENWKPLDIPIFKGVKRIINIQEEYL